MLLLKRWPIISAVLLIATGIIWFSIYRHGVIKKKEARQELDLKVARLQHIAQEIKMQRAGRLVYVDSDGHVRPFVYRRGLCDTCVYIDTLPANRDNLTTYDTTIGAYTTITRADSQYLQARGAFPVLNIAHKGVVKKHKKKAPAFFGGLIKDWAYADSTPSIGTAAYPNEATPGDTLHFLHDTGALLAPIYNLAEPESTPFKVVQQISYMTNDYCITTKGYSESGEQLYDDWYFTRTSDMTVEELGRIIKEQREKCYNRWATIGKAMIKSIEK